MKRKSVFLIIALLTVLWFSQTAVFAANNNLEVKTKYAFCEMEEDYNQKYRFDINVPEAGRMKINLGNLVNAQDWKSYSVRIKADNLWWSDSAVRYWNIKGDQAATGWISAEKGIYSVTIEAPYGANLEDISLYVEYETSNEYVGEIESNNSFDEANLVDFGNAYEGNFSRAYSTSDDYDYFYFDVPSNGKLNLNITNIDFKYSTSAVDYVLYYDDGSNNPKTIVETKAEIDKAIIDKVVRVPAGRYYLLVKTEGRYSCSEYTFKINYTAESSETHEQEWNDFSGDSNLINLNCSYIGNFYKSDDVDWYKLNLAHKGYINAEVKVYNSIGNSDSDFDVSIFDEDFNQIESNAALQPGLYYIRVQGWLDEEKDYQLSTSFLCYKHEYGEVKVIDYAGFNDRGKTERDCKVCGYIDNTTIPAVKKPILSEMIFVYSGKVLTPDIVVKDTKGNLLYNDVDYTVRYNTKCTAVGKHNVEITLMGDYVGKETLYYTIVPKGTASLKAELSGGYDDVKLQWKSVKDATGYLVYYKVDNAKRWSNAIVTQKTNRSFKNLNDGVQYKFKIIPYYSEKNDTLCYFSDDVAKETSVYTLKKVSINKVKKTSKTKVKVSWKNISGETGYQISMSTKKSKTGKITTYKSKSGSSKILKVKKGKQYYYKVRAYKTTVVNGRTKTVYGPWSKVVSYKLK